MTPDEKNAVLFADVSGSTRLYETAGDQVAFGAIGRCVSLLKEDTERSGGRVIKTIGDEIMSVFPSASDAAGAAIRMQGGVAELPVVAGNKLGIRIGFHYGPVMNRDGDVFGDAVNLAARLTELATRDQIITSQDTVEMLVPVLKAGCRPLYPIQVKGKDQEIKLWEVLWRQGGDSTTQAASRSIYESRESSLRLRYHDVEIVLARGRNSLTIGREKNAGLVIRDRMAGRTHGRIERRMEKFVLADFSVNGTFLKIPGEREIILRREEFVLHGSGVIAFGQSCEKTSELVEFQCE